jgi:hypothetical protein
MLQLPLLLLRLIASQTRKRTANSPANTVANALSKIAQLTLSFLAFALGILLLASFAHTLESESAAEGLFAGADGLVPRAGGAVGVVFRDALRADGEGADVGAGVGDVFAGFGFGFLLLGLVLKLKLWLVTGGWSAKCGSLTLSAWLPVRDPRADWAAPVAWWKALVSMLYRKVASRWQLTEST